MSIKLMTAAWDLDGLNSGQKFVLVALCDNASDEGKCWPSVETIAGKCCMGVRTVQRHITDLADMGFLTIHPRPGRTDLFTVNPRQFGTPANLAPLPKTTRTPANLASHYIREPSGTINGVADPVGFKEFWETWPSTDRKADRKKCAEKWKRSKFAAITEEIVVHITAMKLTKKWKDGFEPAPLTYLNGERWKDGLPSEAPSSNAFAGVI